MRRRRVFLVGCAAVAAAALGTVALAVAAAAGSAPGSDRPAAAAGPAPASGQEHQQPQAVSSGGPGACPTGGLDWTATSFSAVPVDPGNWEWLVQEQGRVINDSPAAIVLGDGVDRVARTAPAGQAVGPVVDVALTPAGALVLDPGQAEPYSAAELVQSTVAPRDLGPGLADASWRSAAVAAGCPAPAGAAPAPGAATRLA